jgi:hypothetical protein
MHALRSHGLKEEHCRFFYQQIILALDYCHKMSISNRDIKLENTLLDSTKPDRNPLIKLCDFGYSINESHSLPKTAVGTPGYTGVVFACTPPATMAPSFHASILAMHILESLVAGIFNITRMSLVGCQVAVGGGAPDCRAVCLKENPVVRAVPEVLQ